LSVGDASIIRFATGASPRALIQVLPELTWAKNMAS
jgi:hypothetical protein